jgi:hypothetical protein
MSFPFRSVKTPRQTVAWIVLTAGLAMLSACAQQQKDSPQATLSWIVPQTRAAKPADCPMKMLYAPPNDDYQQIAIVEVFDDYDADQREVIELARRKACESGADALVVLENAQQTLDGTAATGAASRTIVVGEGIRDQPDTGQAGHKGRFFDGAAIVYTGTHFSHDSTKNPH